MVPSGIKRTTNAPYKTRRLENGTVVVEDAYEGRYDYKSGIDSQEIKGLSVKTSSNERLSDETAHSERWKTE